MNHKRQFVALLNLSSNSFLQALSQAEYDIASVNIHKLRVATRRLMSINCIIEVLSNDGYYYPLRKELKRVIKLLNPMRDTQVQIKIVGRAIETGDDIEDFYLYLLNKERKFLERFAVKNSMPANHKISTLLLWQKQFAETQITEDKFTNISIIQAFENIEQELKMKIDKVNKSDEDSIHDLRLITKKYRYMVEIIAKLFPENQIHIKDLKRLQKAMGKIQDLHVLQIEFDKYLTNTQKILSPNLPMFREIIIADKQHKINILMDVLREYDTPKIENYFKKLEYF